MVLLVISDLWQSFDDRPQFEDVILDSTRDSVATDHFFNVSPELADIFADNLRVFNLALFGDLCMRNNWEGDYELEV